MKFAIRYQLGGGETYTLEIVAESYSHALVMAQRAVKALYPLMEGTTVVG